MTRDDEELAAFCAAQFPRLVRMLDLLTGDLGTAEELAQETLVRVASRWSHVRGLDRPDAWARRVAHNLATSRWRRRRAEQRAAARTGPDPVVHHDADRHDHDDVRSALATLPARQREVLVLRHHVGLRVEEVADELGLTASAVTSLTHRAATAMRAALSPTVGAGTRTDHAGTAGVREEDHRA